MEYTVNIIWKIRYFDRNERAFRDRGLYVDTATLAVAEQHALELIVQRRSLGQERDILPFRVHFRELTDEDWRKNNGSPFGSFSVFSLMDYIEDELGNEITREERGPLITGNPNAILIPAGADQADINLMFGPSIPYDLDSKTLSNEELRVIAYFVRDIKSLASTALVKEGPGTLHAGPRYKIETAVSHEEIRACVAIFRTLYMENEPANLKKAAHIYIAATQGTPISRWVAAKIDSYQTELESQADCMIPRFRSTIAFTTKRIIDVFLYTQFAHQPDERRQRQYGECLAQMNNHHDALMWLFLTELQNCYHQMLTIGNVVCRWFDTYCRHRGIAVDYLKSITDSHEGIGKLEKREDASRRMYEERVQAIAEKLWQNAGKPAGGPPIFRREAKVKLDELI
jgi:hypothetical protein